MNPKRAIVLATFAVFAVLGPFAASAEPAVPAPVSKPSFLILGTFHFEGSTSDLMSTSLPNVQSEKRQKEMEAIVEALAHFKPTKIAVEIQVGSKKVQELYDAYLKGERPLGDGEMDQIGFRLAKRMGHAKIWPVDHRSDMDFDGVMKAADQYGQKHYLEQAMGFGQSYMADLTRRIGSDSLSSVLRHMNEPKGLDEGHGLYLLLAQIGTVDDPKGAELLAGWYRRNLLIYTNLVRLVESSEERVLLVIGAGHAKLIRDNVSLSPNLRLEEPLSYLP